MTFPRIALHAGAACIIFYGYEGVKGLQVSRPEYGGLWRYLTIQGINIAGLTMVVSLMVDVFPSTRSLKIIKRSLLMLTLPLNVVISLTYWPLLLFLPTIILPKMKVIPDDSSSANAMIEVLFYTPLHLDLALHAAPAIALFLDFFLFERQYNRRATTIFAPLLASAFTVWYGWWVERCGAKNNGIFPYPFLTDNPFHIRLGIYAGAGFMAPLTFRLLNKLHG